MPLKDLISKINSIKPKVNEWGKEAIDANKKQIVEYVKYGQLSQGLNSLGAPLAFYDRLNKNIGTGFYAQDTQDYADAAGIRKPKTAGSPYNFSWTGETLDKMYLKSINENKATYEIYSKTFKAKYLENIYGKIFDLTDEHNAMVNEYVITPYIYRKLKKELNKLAQGL